MPTVLLEIALGIVTLVLALPQTAYALPPIGAFLGSPYYGSSSIFTNYCFQPPHNGYDYGLYYAPVLAAADGTVMKVQWAYDGCHEGASCDYGLHIYIRHDNGYETRYAHLSATAFDRGATNVRVSAGQIIGTSGDTGNSGDPHLHFEIRNQYGVPVDPGAPNSPAWIAQHWFCKRPGCTLTGYEGYVVAKVR